MEGFEHKIISRAEAKAQGLKYFFTGKPCKKGGIWLRFVSSGKCLCAACREAGKEFSRSYHQENHEAELGASGATAKRIAKPCGRASADVASRTAKLSWATLCRCRPSWWGWDHE
ncbi:hypothetical protein IB238_04750 [Rhizobium sp. ARZ01]|uniref:hypothetical protein n=1 Tax=Rhizobium sp. ARZ01 TaxID=2769313 RepID=UPI00177BC145|nr:hypothetical protein [Rhizobium sp. ARZ01]MBD9371945.1 hypothetical protein [Rhizobium sp. ARZ01]